jgi:predicted kinase
MLHRNGMIDIFEDNTNANPEVRASWVELAQAFQIPIRCVHFTASTRLCEHNDTVRALNPALVCVGRVSKVTGDVAG